MHRHLFALSVGFLFVLAPPTLRADTKVVLIGHGPDHPYRTHCYLPDCELLAKCLRQTDGIEAVVSRGWPEDDQVLADADVIVLHVRSGGDFLFHPSRREQALKLLERGVGLVAVHWGTGCTQHAPDKWQAALGGIFNPKAYSKYTVAKTTMQRAAPEHPISRGWKDYELRDEYYYKLKFVDGATPIAVANVKGEDYPIAWAFERPQGGRSFGFVAGHFHDNFGEEPFRRTIVNGILWTAKREVPQGGAPCNIEPADLELTAEFEAVKKK